MAATNEDHYPDPRPEHRPEPAAGRPEAGGRAAGGRAAGGSVSWWRRARLPLGVLAGLVVILTGLYALSTSGTPAPVASTGPGAAAAAPSAPAASGPAGSPSPSASPTSRHSSTPKSTPDRRVPGGVPNSVNTGVPKGTALATYHGPCTITAAGTVIDAKTVNCDLNIRAANVTIRRSKINGSVALDTDVAGSDRWHYTLVDSEVDAGVREHPAVSYGNMTVLRSNIHGGITSVQCGEHAISCTVEYSWLHGQRIPADADWHLGGFLSNGGRNIRIRHNSIVCDAPVNPLGEGCTGDLNLFGDFAVISDVVVDHNYLGANTGSSFCLYGGDAASKPYPNANNVVITNNMFERGKNGKCAAYGPVSSFDLSGSGNQWSNNTWHDGGSVKPEL